MPFCHQGGGKVSPTETTESFFKLLFEQIWIISRVWDTNHNMNLYHSNPNSCFFFQICIKEDAHFDRMMTYLFVESVSVDHSGSYTCRSSENKTKSVYIHVQRRSNSHLYLLSVCVCCAFKLSVVNASCSLGLFEPCISDFFLVFPQLRVSSLPSWIRAWSYQLRMHPTPVCKPVFPITLCSSTVPGKLLIKL